MEPIQHSQSQKQKQYDFRNELVNNKMLINAYYCIVAKLNYYFFPDIHMKENRKDSIITGICF